MLTSPQIEALRKTNPQLYEAVKRVAGAALGPNQGWSLDNQVTDGANFARVAAGALTNGQVDPTKAGVLMKGSVPPTWSGAFTYISTTSSLTWSWSGLTIFRADGTTTAAPNGSIAIGGLAATTYYFYPYWDDAAQTLGWVAGGIGSPASAQAAKTNLAAQQQALQGLVPLSQGAMVAATTSSGTGGGSGGGSGSCLRAGTMVLTKERGTVEIETCKVGEHLRCPTNDGLAALGRASGEANEGWTRIVRLEIRDADTFIRLHFSNAESLDVTPNHIFTLADGSPMRAERLCLCDVLVGRFGPPHTEAHRGDRHRPARSTIVASPPGSAGQTPSDPWQSSGVFVGDAVFAGAVSAARAQPAKKVTVSCEPTHQFFAGHHAASVLTHNYTFSSAILVEN